MKKAIRMMCVAAVVVVLGSSAMAKVNIETVTVGNLGNSDHTRWASPGYGAVDYKYNIGKYEVTAGQYAEFLNAVAGTDAYGLYNAAMNADSSGCQITRRGDSGNYTYDFSGGAVEAPGSTADDWRDRPVNFVSWGDAARFANWLHNGQPTGTLTGDPAQDAGLTEDGAYYLNGATSKQTLGTVIREADWKWAITSEDEWYKAAYHKNDPDPPGGNYFDYPTGSDSTPGNDLVDPDPGNNATFKEGNYDYTIGAPYYRTEAGAHENSESPYDTFDQGANLWEWNETIDGWYRGMRGGGYDIGPGYYLRASFRHGYYPSYEDAHIGFRVSQVPEPATLSLLALGGLTVLRRRREQ